MTTAINEVLEFWEVSRLVPYEHNAKVHTAKQVKALARLIKQAGWTQPIVVQKGTGSIIAGHGRRLAALELGLKQVPVIVADVSDEMARAMRLADNRVSSTDYDATMIQNEIIDLQDLGFDISLMAFEDNELAFLTDNIGEINDDAFVDDVSEAVEAQKTANAAASAAAAESDSPLSKAFGIKRLGIKEGRRVKSFMVAIERKSGKTGVDALMAHLDEFGIL